MIQKRMHSKPVINANWNQSMNFTNKYELSLEKATEKFDQQ